MTPFLSGLYVRRLYARTLIFDDADGDLNIAPGRIGVGADLVGGVGKLLGCGLVLSWDGNLQVHCELEAFALLSDAHSCPHRRVTQLDLLVAGNGLQRGVEASGVAGGK